MNTASIPYPIEAEVADFVRRNLANRIGRIPALRSTTANPIILAITLALIPTAAGQNSDMADPSEWLSQSQRDWAIAQSDLHNLPDGWLEQSLANYHPHQLTQDPNYILTEQDYNQVLEETLQQAQSSGVIAAAPSGPYR
ncbi:hypothetical protein ACMA5I_10920 [Paracoccaceae bacterium GXU_MW_L88]